MSQYIKWLNKLGIEDVNLIDGKMLLCVMGEFSK